MRKRILIVGKDITIPPQLHGKFHEVIVFPDSAQLLKSKFSLDHIKAEAKSWVITQVNKLIGVRVNQIAITYDFKKFNYTVDDFMSDLQNADFYESLCSKYQFFKARYEYLLDVSSVKAKFNREFNSPSMADFKDVYRRIQEAIVLVKKGNVNNYLTVASDLVSLLSDLVVCESTKLGGYLEACKSFISEAVSTYSISSEFDDFDSVSKIVGSLNTPFAKLTREPKQIDEYNKRIRLYNSALIAQKVCPIEDADYFVAGKNEYDLIRKYNNLGLRNTNWFYQAKMLKCIKVHNGANLIIAENLNPIKQNIDKLAYYFSDSFAQSLIPELPKVMRTETTSEGIINTLTNLTKFDVGHKFGMDYETNGEEINTSKFEMIGVSLANTVCAVYLDFRYVKLLESPEKYQLCLDALKALYDKHGNNIWVFNYSFERAVTYKLFKKQYEFCDANIYHILNSNHTQWWSLKYTAQYFCRVRSWDDNYDGVMEIITPYLHDWDSAKKTWVDKPDSLDKRENLRQCILAHEQIAKYVDDFMFLYDHGYRSRFTVIPWQLIGYYGALDSYYTTWIDVINEGKYPDLAIRTFLDNNRLGARLTGIYRNEKVYKDYFDYSNHLLGYGLYHSARHFYWCQIKYYGEKIGLNSLEDIKSKIAELSGNQFTRFVLSNYIDFKTRDRFSKSLINFFGNKDYESGIDENQAYFLLGQELGGKLVQLWQSIKFNVSEALTGPSLDDIYKSDQSCDDEDGECSAVKVVESEPEEASETRSETDNYKLLIKAIGDTFWPMVNITNKDNIDDIVRVARMNTSLFYLDKCSARNLTADEFCKLQSVNFRYRVTKFTDFIAQLFSYFSITSPGQYKMAFDIIAHVFKKECSFLAHIDNKDVCHNTDPDLIAKYLPFTSFQDVRDKMADYIANGGYDQSKNTITTIFMSDGTKVPWKPKDGFDYRTAEKLQPVNDNNYCQAQKYRYLLDEKFTGDNQASVQEEFYQSVKEFHKMEYGDPLMPCLIAALSTVAKKFQKMNSNYFCGVYGGPLKLQGPADENLQSTLEGDTPRLYPRFDVNMKTTKRWGAGIHCVYGKSTSKRILAAPKGYGISYFDISSAEVRTAAYLSKDQQLIDDFESGKDVYMLLAERTYPGHDKAYYKKIRKVFKKILLAQLYGQGAPALAQLLEMTLDEVQHVIESIFGNYPTLDKFIKSKQQFCITNRRIDTFLGDELTILETDPGRLRRVGINYLIQGGTAATLAHGFYNLTRVSDQHNLGINPIITVHDSVINYFPLKGMLGKLNQFYRTNFTDFIRSETGIQYEFDTMVGADYTVPCKLIEENGIITLEGDDYGISQFLCKVTEEVGTDGIEFVGACNLDPTLNDPILDMVRWGFDQASFGTCDNYSSVSFKYVK